jgi:predicted AAA+ superfamily ATPase
MIIQYFSRWLNPVIQSSLEVTPALFVNGPRQAGKSTLVKQFTQTPVNAHYVSFDDLSTRAAAENDPLAFLKNFKSPVIIDEVQLVPSLFRSLKLLIDGQRQENRQKANGHFILTGSTNIMALPGLADSLVGRVRILTLLPFSMGEYANCQPIVGKLFDNSASILSGYSYEEFYLEDWIYQQFSSAKRSLMVAIYDLPPSNLRFLLRKLNSGKKA